MASKPHNQTVFNAQYMPLNNLDSGRQHARKDAPSADRAALNVKRAADETGADPVAVARHAALFSRPAQDAMHTVILC